MSIRLFNQVTDPNVLVSVLVPSYNAGIYLRKLVESVLGQTHAHWELLILDDGSGDLDYPGVADCLQDPRIRTFRWTSNRGVSQATQFLMKEARGEFWCYPGADDVLGPEFITKRLIVMASHPEVSLVFGRGGQIDAEGKETWFDLGRGLYDRMQAMEDNVIDPEKMLRLLLAGNIINTPSIMARSRATLPILTRYHMDWRYCQDWFYWLLLAGNGLSFYYCGEVLHSYRFHEQSLTSSQSTWAWRNVEPALVLLVGMALSSQTSELGRRYYRRCRMELYGNWLVRSAKFRGHPSWENWASLATMVSITPLEWIWVAWWVMKVFGLRRKARREGKVLHGLPSPYFNEPLFA
jgi:glycosyltransferase involved in cell wall biosynthesis